MAELLLVSNPRRRKRRAKSGRKRRQPAALRAYWAARRGKKTAHRRRRRRHSAHAAAPRRRRRSRRVPVGARMARGYVVGSKRIRRRKLNPHRRHHYRRRHHNPSLRNITGQIMPTVKSGGVGAVGALALDGLWGLLNNQLPSLASYLTNPYVAIGAKAFGAVAVGALGGKVWRGKGRDMAVGAMTVQLHDFFKTLLQQTAPGIFGAGGSFPLGAYLSGAAPIVGTATIPQSYLPFSGIDPGGPLGAYMSGSTGYNDGSSGMFYDDATGY